MAIAIPSNVKAVVTNNTVTITFTKGAGATRTEIDRFWVNGQGTFDAYTSYSSLYYDKLAWGTNYKFQLRSWNTAGEIAVDPTIYEFNTPAAIIPTIPTNVKTVVDKNTATITFTKGAGVKTEIDKFWVGSPLQGTWDEYTTGNGFYYTGLAWGTLYKYQLRSVSNDGSVAVDPTIYQFQIEPEIIPTAPSNVNVVVFKNNAEIRFTKGAGIRTDIDKYWVNGQGTWDESTATDQVFYVNNLAWGSHNTFKLRSVGNTGLVAETAAISFDIEPEIVPTAPSGVSVEVFANTATIHFTKGIGVKTEIDKYWVNGSGTWDEYTSDAGFYIENLAWGTHFEFKLRSVGNTGLAASDNVVYSFDVEPAIIPTAPTAVNVDVFKNTVGISFTKGTCVRTEIAKSWGNGLNVWDEYTSGNGFWYEQMPWGTHCQFKLRSTSNTGAVAETSVFSFDIEEAIVPTPCQAIEALVYKNTAEIHMVRGEGEKIQIINLADGSVFDYTTGEAFFLENLPWGAHFDFVLRSVSNDLSFVDSEPFSIDVEMAIIPTPCQAIDPMVYKNTCELHFVRGEGEKIQIINLADGSVFDYTYGEAFFLENLPWGTHFDFVLRSVSNTGEYVDSDMFSIDVEEAIIPTPCQAIMTNVFRNTAEIFFVRGEGEKIQLIDLSNGSVLDYTYGEAMYEENLVWGRHYDLILRSVSNTGEFVDSEPFSFDVEAAIVPTAPRNIVSVVDKNTLTVTFDKGACIRTEICKSWGSGIDVWDEYTSGSAFYFEDMPWGRACSFKLRSLSNTGAVAETQVFTVNIEIAIIPTAPSNVIITIDEAQKNYVTINFSKGDGIKTEIDKFWVGGQGTYEEYTTGQGFLLEGLAWGQHYEFKLRSVSNTGAVAETSIYGFDIVPNPTPTVPTNVTQEIIDNTVTIRFDKGVGAKTEVDCSWINGLGTYDSSTTGSAFYFENLPYDSMLQYKLRTVSVGGQTAESITYTFYTGIQGDI